MSSDAVRSVARVLDPSADEMSPPNSMVYDGDRARAGLRLNKFAYSLKGPANRAAFNADRRTYMSRFALTEAEQALVLAEDWLGLVQAGANIYVLVKLTGSMGSNLVKAGLQMRAEDLAAFKQSRPGGTG